MHLLVLLTIFHVLISLIGIASGLWLLYGFVKGVVFRTTAMVFLITTIVTSATGFLFPIHGMTPGLALGIVSLPILALCWAAYNNAWAKTFVVSAMIAEFLNVVVLIVQSFLKIPVLHAIAPKGNEPVIAAVQLVALLLITVATFVGARRTHFAAV